MDTISYAFAPITKVEEQDDGTVMVYGPAADAGVDRDKQRLNQQWLDQAMPQWMAEGGNLRAQHDAKQAVGVGVGLTRADDGAHLLAAAVVDPVAILKVKPGPNGRPPVFKGFSVGIKDPQINFGKADAPNGEVVGGSIVEVSLVDRPANPRTLFTMVKADGSGDLADVEDPEVEELDEEDGTEDDGDADETVKADQIAAVLADVTALVPDLNKADVATDVADAKTAIAAIGRLIQSEAGTMAGGQMSDAGDIACLLDAVHALKFFIAREQAEVPPDGDGADGDGITDGDALDISGGTYMTEPTGSKADAPDLTKTEQAEIVKAYGERIAAVETQGERIAALEEQLNKAEKQRVEDRELLEKVLALPRAGGPVAMRTASDAAQARAKDTDVLKAQAADLKRKAAATEDLTLRQGYLDNAAILEKQANA